MTISQTAEYALRATLHLAARTAIPLSTRQIARATHVPAGYLSKVLQELSHAGMVTSRVGRRGGFVLARPAAQVSILDVINAVDPIERIGHCPLGLAEHYSELCPLHERLEHALGLLRQAFAETTLAELLREHPALAAPSVPTAPPVAV
jgi:Rrf2 family protein